MRMLARYAARNENFVLGVSPHNGLGRAERAKRHWLTSRSALPGYQRQSPWLVAAIVWALLLAGAVAWPVPALTAQNVLPEAPGRDVTVRLCANCHAAETVASVRHTPEGWREVIARMVAAGAKGTEQELETVVQYLSTQFPAEAQQALNLNTARAVELESVAGLLRKEAAALLAHREKHGPCKQLEDLKKVQGLDYKKIEARKARLTCQ
jgi:competence protein ComEA